jgi:hypothetical protein
MHQSGRLSIVQIVSAGPAEFKQIARSVSELASVMKSKSRRERRTPSWH